MTNDNLKRYFPFFPRTPSVSGLALQSVQLCEREAWLGRAGRALSGEERVEFLKVVTDDESDR